MKNLLALAVFLLATVAYAGGKCPPSPDEGIDGEIRCGHIHCSNLQTNAWYLGGGICQHQPQYYCLVDCMPRRRIESAETKIDQGHLVADVTMRTKDGRVFDNKPGRVVMYVNGLPTLEGRYKRGVFYWDNGTQTGNIADCSVDVCEE